MNSKADRQQYKRKWIAALRVTNQVSAVDVDPDEIDLDVSANSNLMTSPNSLIQKR